MDYGLDYELSILEDKRGIVCTNVEEMKNDEMDTCTKNACPRAQLNKRAFDPEVNIWSSQACPSECPSSSEDWPSAETSPSPTSSSL